MFSIFQGPQGPPGGLGNPGPIGEKVWTLKVFQHISIECANQPPPPPNHFQLVLKAKKLCSTGRAWRVWTPWNWRRAWKEGEWMLT